MQTALTDARSIAAWASKSPWVREAKNSLAGMNADAFNARHTSGIALRNAAAAALFLEFPARVLTTLPDLRNTVLKNPTYSVTRYPDVLSYWSLTHVRDLANSLNSNGWEALGVYLTSLGDLDKSSFTDSELNVAARTSLDWVTMITNRDRSTSSKLDWNPSGTTFSLVGPPRLVTPRAHQIWGADNEELRDGIAREQLEAQKRDQARLEDELQAFTNLINEPEEAGTW